MFLSLSGKIPVSVYKTRCLPEGADLGFGGFPQQAKIRLGSTQTLLATIVPKTVYDSSALSVHISH